MARNMVMEKKVSKSALARSLGISRSSLYYVPKQIVKDINLREKILETLDEHPAYGHKRIALNLGIGKNRALRVMAKFGIRPHILRKTLKYGRKTSIYLATVIDRFTREVISWQIGLHHTTQLVIDVLEDALKKRTSKPQIFHSDQGSEYTSNICLEWIVKHKILPSHSPKSKPWNNGHQESFYGKFKLEFGKPSRHQTIELLIEAIGRHIHYYNTRRIHSALKMPPRVFYEKEVQRLENMKKSEQEGV